MDAPISMTLAHLIIIWTLSVFLLAWMLTFAILAVRSNASHKDETRTARSQEQGNTPNRQHTGFAVPTAVTTPPPLTYPVEAVPFMTYQPDIHDMPVTHANNEVPARV